MKFATRHIAWAPLLLIAAAISYGLVVSMHDEPCAEERHAWMIGRVIAATFALYLFTGYWLAVTRKYLGMAILTLWAWHLLILSPILVTRCSEQRSLNQLRQVIGIGLPEFAIVIALMAIAGSFALFLRYRMVNGAPVVDRRTFLRFSVAGATVVAVALVAGAYWIVPLFREAYSAFGADLPTLTLVAMDTYRYWAVLPLACAGGYLYIRTRDQYSDRQLQIALNGAIVLIVFLNIASSTLAFSILAPVKTLCSCV